MTRVVVDLAALAQFVGQLELLQRQLLHAHDTVGQQVARLHVQWTGRAAATHAAAHTQWAAAATEVSDALATLRAIGSDAHANYAAAVAANRRMWLS